MDRRDVLTAAARSAVGEAGAPGLSVAVAAGGEAAEVAVGHADLAGDTPMRTDTVFRAGSMSKLYTATAVMQLVDRGRLRLDDPVRTHLPHLAVTNPLGDRDVTVEDLLSFRSGLAVDTTGAGLSPAPDLAARLEQAYARPVLREYHAGLPLWTAPVGERYQYSNLGVATLGHLVEVAGGEGTTFDRYVAEHVLWPLGMDSSAFVGGSAPVIPERLRARMATGYMKFGRTLVPSPALCCADYPANGLVTTAGDHLKMVSMLARRGRHEGRRILSAGSAEAMLRPRTPIGDHRIAPDGSWWVGLGVMLANLGTADFHFGHPGGYMWGWWSVSRVYPERGLAYVILVNAWDMCGWHDPLNPDAASLLAEALPRVAGRDAATRGWRRGYAAGWLLAERTCGFLGAADAGAERLLGAVADQASGPDAWDGDGFRAGVRDALAPGGSKPAGLVSLDGARDPPVPLMFWPDLPAPVRALRAATADERPAARRASRS